MQNTEMDQETPGTNSQTGWLMMSVEQEGIHVANSFPTEIVGIWQSILSKCASFLAGVIYTTPDGPTKPTTIVISYVPKKTPEKSGVQ